MLNFAANRAALTFALLGKIGMYLPFIKHRKIFYIFSAILVGLSVASIFVFGLKLGIDFKGGSLLSLQYKERMPGSQEIRERLNEFDLGAITVQQAGEKGILLEMKEVSEETHQKVLEELKKLGEIEEGSESFQSIGPVIGKELSQKTKIVVVLSLFAILLYIAFSFRRISRPVKSYIYGLTSLIALGHDVLIPLGTFAFLGRFYEIEITIPIIVALLTVFGYSINDTVVVFDRIRENLLRFPESTFDLTVEKSLNQTLTRSLNTSLTTLLVLVAIFLFGGETLRYFSLALILGISFGTYSSIFLASPLVVSYLHFKEKKYK